MDNDKKQRDWTLDERVVCPFCQESDFDLIGLKLHIDRGWCYEFEDLDVSSRFVHGHLLSPLKP